MLDRDAVFQAQAAKSSRAAHDGTAFIQMWRDSREKVQATWSDICDIENRVEKLLEGALALSPEVYDQLIVRVPEVKIEDALLPAL